MLNLDEDIRYISSSHRRFEQGERHVSRFSRENVLLLVYEGELCFEENESPVSLKRGEYYIQEKNMQQTGSKASDSPQYYYVHFSGEWTSAVGLKRRGNFDESIVIPLCNRLEEAKQQNATLLQKNLILYTILQELYQKNQIKRNALAEKIMAQLNARTYEKIQISEIASQMYISTNYLISVFKKEYGITPHKHLSERRLQEAMNLLKSTDKNEEEIADAVGFSDFSVFYKAFKKRFAISPSAVRRG